MLMLPVQKKCAQKSHKVQLTCLLNCLPGPRGIIEEEEEEVFVFVDVVEVLGIAGTHTRARV